MNVYCHSSVVCKDTNAVNANQKTGRKHAKSVMISVNKTALIASLDVAHIVGRYASTLNNDTSSQHPGARVPGAGCLITIPIFSCKLGVSKEGLGPVQKFAHPP